MQALSVEPTPCITLEDIVKARAKLAKSNTNGGKSGTVNEWIVALHMALLFSLLIVFNATKRREIVEILPSWLTLTLIFFNKKTRPTCMKEFRGIGLLDCMSKSFMGCLMMVARKMTHISGWWLHLNSMAYKAKGCMAHVALTISTIFHRTYEWDVAVSCVVF